MEHKDPSILVFDATKATADAMAKLKGIDCTFGSFGSPYSIARGSRLCLVDSKDMRLLGYKEADGFLIDLRQLPMRSGGGVKRPPDYLSQVFTSGVDGAVDPRPYVMSIVRPDLDRVLAHGGVFVIFVQPIEAIEYRVGHLRYEGERFEQDWADTYNNYSFSSVILDRLSVTSDHGRTMYPLAADTPIGHLLSRHLDGGSFTCVLKEPGGWKLWTPLAENKYGACVAAARIFNDNGGMAVLLPSVADEPKFVAGLFLAVLPELCPKVFPDLQRGTWAMSPPYELDSVITLQQRATEIREAAAKEVGKINSEIAAARSTNSYLFELVRGTGSPLVGAVKTALAELGFNDVVDMDEYLKAANQDASLREDLQIRDRSPLLTVDVKGLLNFPTDDDALQAHKHASIAVQELKRFDIQALALINHQRKLPPLERDNEMPFREELLKVAAHVKMGMLTTWDLHRLVRNAKKWNWKPADILPVLYRVGRIQPIPEHYTLIGTVEHFYDRPQAASIRISEDVLGLGQRIAFELPVEFHEQLVESLRIDNKDVEAAPAGSLCGVVTIFRRDELKLGTRVYHVRTDDKVGSVAGPAERPDSGSGVE